MVLDHLFRAGKIGALVLKNRVILPAMGTLLPEEDGSVSRGLIDYHAARARGGCGLNIVEVAAVHPTTKGPHYLAVYDDRFIPGLSELAEAIKEAGGKACLQLWHAGRQTNSFVSGLPIVAPSPIPCPKCREMPRELTQSEIRELISAYGDAALRARRAGFDAVEVHGAHGYLIAQFMSAYSNRRTDEYGGPLENRIRFALEVVKDIREKVGPDFPVLFRLSADEYVKDGLNIAETKRIAGMLEKAGVNAIHVSAGNYETLFRIIPPLDFPVAVNADNAAAVKSVTRLPVIAALRINDPVLADRLIRDGQADFVAVGRGQIADPEFCNKAQAGDLDSIVKCVGCNQGCVDRNFLDRLPISCLRNPAAGREAQYALQPARQRKKVLVVGGGPAGLEAATILRKRGHDVLLVEKSDHLGGQFLLAGAAPRKKEMAEAALQMGRTAERQGVRIRLNTPFSATVMEEFKPDDVVVATGSTPIVPPLPGIQKAHVVKAHDVLAGLEISGEHVAVIGGGLVGLEAAELLCSRGKRITIVELLDKIGNGLGPTRRLLAKNFIAEHNIEVHLNTKCLEIKDRSLVVERSGAIHEIGPIDAVVIAVGVAADRTVENELSKMGCRFHVIGDARQARKALDAIWEGADAGRAI